MKEPTAARKPASEYPLRPKAYCPWSSDSLPLSLQAAAAVIVKLRGTVTDWVGVLESLTLSENVEVPAAVGVPEIVQLVPEPVMDSHDGSVEPDAMAHA